MSPSKKVTKEALDTPEGRRWLVQRSIPYFVTRYLKGALRDWRPIPNLHIEWYKLATSHLRLAIHAPRDHAKSSVFSVIYPLWRICVERAKMFDLGWPNNPDVVKADIHERIVIISKTSGFAEGLLVEICHQLEVNEKIKEDFGKFKAKGALWSITKGVHIKDKGPGKDPTLQAKGRGNQIAGGRLTCVILDDVEDYESTRIESRREGTWQWFGRDVANAVVSMGQIVLIGTAQHQNDLIHRLRNKGFYEYRHYSAEHPPESISPKPGQRSLWPSRYPYLWDSACTVPSVLERDLYAARLLCKECPVFKKRNPGISEKRAFCLAGKRVEVGSLFYRCQFLNDLEALSGDIFKPHWFIHYDSKTIVKDEYKKWWINKFDENGSFIARERVRVFAGCDPAIGEKTENDHFAIILIAVDSFRNVYIIGCSQLKIDFPSQVALLRRIGRSYNPEMIGVEAVAFQKAIVQQTLSEDDVAIKGIQSTTDKHLRIVACSPMIEAGKVLVDETTPAGQLFFEEMTQYPNKAHDDVPDGYEIALNVAGLRGSTGGWVAKVDLSVKRSKLEMKKKDRHDKDFSYGNVSLKEKALQEQFQ